MNLYNEFDPGAAAWIDQLIDDGRIPAGRVERRSIAELAPADVADFTQAHFFCGIAGWSLALDLAGWPAWLPVWTGSCPCQPFSQAGPQLGFADPRHLWPVWWPLIRSARPAIIFGEQVAKVAGVRWFDAVRSELAVDGYAAGFAVLTAAGIGAPHIRERLYWMAYDCRARLEVLRIKQAWAEYSAAQRGGAAGELGDPGSSRGRRYRRGLSHAQSRAKWRVRRFIDQPGVAGDVGGLVHSDGRRRYPGELTGKAARYRHSAKSTGGWPAVEWLECRDGKSRPVEPGTFPLVDGLPGRVGLLRGYGNAIVPQLAATFIIEAMRSIS